MDFVIAPPPHHNPSFITPQRFVSILCKLQSLVFPRVLKSSLDSVWNFNVDEDFLLTLERDWLLLLAALRILYPVVVSTLHDPIHFALPIGN